MSQMATAEGEKKEAGNYAAKRDAATAELTRLQSLSLRSSWSVRGRS